ncbi:MAG: hypothetical protein R3F59_38860 [Myxococcota bacterium]
MDLPDGVLHLKCICSSPAPQTVVVVQGALPDELFAGLRHVLVPPDEAYAANTVGHGGRVLVAAGHPGNLGGAAAAGARARPRRRVGAAQGRRPAYLLVAVVAG